MTKYLKPTDPNVLFAVDDVASSKISHLVSTTGEHSHLTVEYPDFASVPADFVGEARIANANYQAHISATLKNGVITRTTKGYSDSIADRPSASLLGNGTWQIGNSIYTSDGIKYGNPISVKKYVPSSYVAIKSASTTVTGQSEKIASGVNFIYVKNLDATNTVKIGFGTDYTTAEAAAAASTDIAVPFLEFNFPVPVGMTHYSWLGVGGTVSAIIGMGE